jgi:hypothetical protein
VENITKHPAYNAVDPADFPAMLDVNRYGQRSIALDKIISATHDIFWDPLDRAQEYAAHHIRARWPRTDGWAQGRP